MVILAAHISLKFKRTCIEEQLPGRKYRPLVSERHGPSPNLNTPTCARQVNPKSLKLESRELKTSFLSLLPSCMPGHARLCIIPNLAANTSGAKVMGLRCLFLLACFCGIRHWVTAGQSAGANARGVCAHRACMLVCTHGSNVYVAVTVDAV